MTDDATPRPTTSAEARRLLLARRLKGKAQTPRPTPAAASRTGRGELTPAQQRLWVHQQLRPESAAFTIGEAVRIEGPLETEALRRAAAEVTARHEPLRSTFHESDGVPYTEVHAELLPDVTLHTPAEPDAAALLAQVLERPFDLARGPMLRLDLMAEREGSHVLVLSTHHIVGDGWSMSLLIRELTTAYLRLTGTPLPRPEPLAAHWSDTVREQLRRRADGEFDAQLAYWKQHLADAAPLPRTPEDDADGDTLAISLSPELTARLHEACRARQVTPYMALLGAFATVVARRTADPAPVIGTPVAGRPSPETEALIGYFSNTLPLRVDVGDSGTVADLWHRCRQATLGALAHQEVSLAEITEAVYPAGSPGTQLFQALFALQNYPYEPIAAQGVTITPLAVPKNEAKLDLSLYLYEHGGRFEGYLEYRTARWEGGVEKIAAELVRTVEAMAEAPDGALADTARLSEDERRLLLTERMGVERDFPDTTLHGLFEATADRSPDCVALTDSDGTDLSYAQTEARANRLAHRLIAHGVRPGDRVALMLPRGSDLIVALLATLKAGATFVPVDPAYPAPRIRAMITGSAAHLLLVTDELAAAVPDLPCATLRMPTPDEDAPPATRPDLDVPSAQAAYVIFTSGSTGTPKGIAITHRGVVNHNLGCVEVFGLVPDDRVLHLASPSFDASIEEIFPVLAVGGRVVSRPDDLIDSFPRLDRFVAEHGITMLALPAAYWEHWYEHLRESGTTPAPCVRIVTLSGQRVNPESMRHWQDNPQTAHVALINTYGPTEATVTTTTFSVAGGTGTAPTHGDVPIGTPWPNYRPYVVDGALRLVPDGAVGELCVGGIGVGMGYIGAAAATAERFVPDPFAGTPGARMYRTGDYVRWRADGGLDFIGRIDGQVKIRGNRVEIGEIESALATHPAVSQCAVVAYPDARGDHHLGAHVVLRDDTPTADLAAHLAARLPAYMVPGAFAVHPALPLTANGKVDRRALPEPTRAATDSEPPRGPVETALAAVWQDVLKLDTVARDDDFFARGGTSLTATVLVSRVERDLHRALPLAELFARPTLASMAAYLEGADRADLAPLTAAPDGDTHPASPAQRQIYFTQLATGATTSYNMPVALRVEGAADPDLFRAALQRLVDRHEALRTTFHVSDGEVRQRVEAHRRLEFGRTDLAPDAATGEAVAALVRPFDLADGPLLRAHWLHLADEEGLLFIDLHHIAADATAVRVLVEEFLALLDGTELPEVAVRYRDFAHWQLARHDARAADLGAYWRERLEDLPELCFPYDRPRPRQAGPDGFTTEFTVPAAVAQALADAARAEQATLNIALLAVFATALGRHADQPEVVVGSLVAGRHHPDLQRTVGMFANFLPVRIGSRPDDTFRSLLARTRAGALADYDHQELPFDEIVALAGQPRRAGRNPLFDTMLIFQDADTAHGPRRSAGLSFDAQPVRHGTAKLDLKFDVFPEADGSLRIEAEANRALLDPASVRRFTEHFTALCAAAGASPDVQLSALAPLTPQQSAELARKRAASQSRGLDLAVVASFTAEPLEAPLRWWGERFGLDLRTRFAEFGQVFQQLLDPAGLWHTHQGPALLLVRFEDWIADLPADGGDRVQHLEQSYGELCAALRPSAAGHPRLVGVLPPDDASGADAATRARLAELTARWRRDAGAVPGVTVVDLAASPARFGLTRWADPAAYALGKVPYTQQYFAAAATDVARQLVTAEQQFKVSAVDADNTLWRGVVGEDGVAGLHVDEAAHAVQDLLLRKRADGMLLALVSKNAEADVLAALTDHPDMRLRPEHFAAVRANWQPKSQNLREIAGELGLGLDSFVFLDDSGAECAEVMAALPQVLTLRLPQDRAEHPLFLDHVWAFDTHHVTAEDRLRAERYQAERRRRADERAAPSLDAFLAGMELEASFTPAAPQELERVAQLTRRTNQFNLSGLRLSHDELVRRTTEDGMRAYVLHVRDRFGDHGLTGAILATVRDGTLHLDNVLLSCRVLGRTVEEAVLAGLAQVCAQTAAGGLTARFTPTERNEPARLFLDAYDWRRTHEDGSGSDWELPVGELPGEPRFVTLRQEPLPHRADEQQDGHQYEATDRAVVTAAGPAGTAELATSHPLDHMGVAVPSLEDAVTALTRLGYLPSDAVEDPLQRSRLVILEKPGHPRIELVAPTGADSPTTRILKNSGPQPYHLCYRVRSLAGTRQAWSAAGLDFDPVEEPVPAVLFGGDLVQFFAVDGVGLVELRETGADLTGPAPAPTRDETRIAALVQDTEAAQRFFALLGYRADPGPAPADALSRTVLLRRPGCTALELVQPAGPGTPLADALAQSGPRPLALRVAGPLDDDRPAYLTPLTAQPAAGEQSVSPRWPTELHVPEGLLHHAYYAPLRHPVAAGIAAAAQQADSAPDQASAPYTAPRTETERTVTEAFGRVLGVDRIGIHDSFFALGGHSLKAVTLLAGLERTLGSAPGLDTLFAHPTPAALAAALDRSTTTVALQLPHSDTSAEQPASAAQRRFYVLQHLDPHGTQYNLPYALRIDGPLDTGRVHDAFNRLLERHEILRTSLRLVDGELRQVVHDPATLRTDVPVRDGELPAEDELRRFVRPFDLTAAPLLRMAVVRYAEPADDAHHVLLVDLHHGAADGVTLGLLVSEFADLYAGRALEPVRQYRDWAALERTAEYRGRLAADEQYWLERFAELQPRLELPADHSRPPVWTGEGDSIRFTVPAQTVAGLQAVGRGADATLYATMLAAFYVTLWRHTGQTDLVVGTPFAGRTVPGTAQMAGPFLNTLPMRTRIVPQDAFDGFLDQVRTSVAEALRHQDYPFEELVERLAVERDASRNPLFDVMFSFQNMALPADGMAGLDVQEVEVTTGRSLFDLELTARPEGDEVQCRLDFATALFRRDTAEQFVRRFRTVLDHIARAPRCSLAELDVLGADERATLLAGLGAHEAELPDRQTVLSRIEAVAAADPDRVAVVRDAEQHTYGQLDAGARTVAAGLHTGGVRRQDVIGVLADRGPRMVEAILGIWKAGGAFVLLDVRHPVDRMLGILTDAGSELLLAEPELLPQQLAARFPGRILGLDDLPAGAQTPPAEAAVTPDDLAYILFTSGSTGRPKGAMVEQRGMLNHMLAKAEDLALDADTALVQNASPSFDIAVWQLLGALVAGGRTLVCDNATAADPRALLRASLAHGATVLEVVPSMLEVMLDLLEREPVPLPRLRALVSTGEALPHGLAARWLRAYPDIALVNAYGPTEASDDITHNVVTAQPPEGTVPLGRPIRNARIYVVDTTIALETPGGGALAPTGAKGEICVAGPCVGRGYIKDPARTEAAFRPDPFVGGRLYRTGDIGRWLPDGTLEFLGRMDAQVKLRGYRIELGEIEAALDSDPHLTACAVLVHRTPAGNEQLVAYVVPGAGAPPSAKLRAAVVDRLSATLPGYMLPDVVVALPELPLTPNGKTDRKALPAPGPDERALAAVPLEGNAEHLVAELFGEVLGVEQVDAAADFFRLGGHSLRVVGLVVRIQQRTGIELPLADVFQAPTVRALARRLDQARRTGGALGRRHVNRLGLDTGSKAFLFPPIAGWGLVYLPLSQAVTGHSLIVFDFVEQDHRVRHYADLVEEHQPAGPLVLGGYSAGGNLAYEVTRELESRGRTVETLLLFDSVPRTAAEDEDAKKLAERVRRDMEAGLDQLDPELREVLSEPGIQDAAAHKREQYTHYWNALVHTGPVGAHLVLVRAEESVLDDAELTTWRSLTTAGLEVAQGSGTHPEMMAGTHAKSNAELVQRVLDRRGELRAS